MANTTILQLPATSSLNGDEWFEVVQSGASRRAQVAAVGRNQYPYVFATIATFTAATIPSTVLQVPVEGYYSAGDGGGATYRRVSGPDVATVQTADGGYWTIDFGPFQTPKQFGALGTGSANDTAFLVVAFQAAVRYNFTLDGRGKTYGVSGNLQLTYDDLRARNIGFRQLDPNSTTRRTLYLANCNRLVLDTIWVDRNGNGTYGSLTGAAGIWITGGTGHVINNMYSYGNDKGSGVVISLTSEGKYTKISGYNIAYNDTSAADDQIQGVWIDQNTDCHFDGVYGYNLSGNATGQPSTRWTRAIALSGNTDCSFTNLHGHDVDQGLDATGGGGNVNCSFSTGSFRNCSNWGIKLANSAQGCTVSNFTIINPGISGVVASGPSASGLPILTTDNRVDNVIVVNPGAIASGTAQEPVGFLIEAGSYNLDTPNNIMFSNCLALDNQNVPTMVYGFKNQIAFARGSKMNEMVNCRSYGHTTAVSYNMNTPSVKAYVVTNQSIPHATSTPVNFGAESYDYADMHSTSSNINIFYVPVSGLYTIVVQVTFAANGTGYRRADLLRNGVAIKGAFDIRNAITAAGVTTTVTVTTTTYVLTTDNLRVQVTQDSGGGALDVVDGAFNIDLVQVI